MLTTTTALTALMSVQCPALAGPTGGTVVQGAAGISQAGSVTNINQSSNRAIINWLGFSIGTGETVNFNQPSSASATLNRVVGNESSVISGALRANGQVFIVNSAGVLFTKGAQVNVGGLVASTLDISNQNFMAGNYSFSGSSPASVVNQGRIHASPGGYVALLGKTVANDGVITARLGTVAIASGDKITLNFAGNSLFDVTIDQGTLNALVENRRAIIADGGRVIMTAKAADAVLSAQVNNTGIIQARTMAALKGGAGARVARAGSIKLYADGGTVNVAGRLDASAPKGGNGGAIETSGNKVKVADSAVITTKAQNGQNGTWLIDPDGFTIAAAGGDITGTTLASELTSNNVTILSTMGSGTDGNINVNDTVTWSANTTLTLNATNAINVNAVITGSGAASGLQLIAGTDITVNAPASLNVNTLTATAVNNVNLSAPQSWTNAGTRTFAGNNINVYDTVNWSAGTLTLKAGSFINVVAVMTASGTGSLVATYNPGMDTSTDSSGSPTPTYGTPFGGINLFNPKSGIFFGSIDFTNSTAANPLTINGSPYTLITSIGSPTLPDGTPNPHDLNVINANGGIGFYALATNLTAPSTAFTHAPINGFGGVDAKGNLIPTVLEGLGHNIVGLTIATNSVTSNLGLISTNSGTVRDIGLTNVSVTAPFSSNVGTLVGMNKTEATIINVAASGGVTVINEAAPVTGTLTGVNAVGGLVGDNAGIIYSAWTDVHVNAKNVGEVSGIAGLNFGSNRLNAQGQPQGQGIISNSKSIGEVDLFADSANFSQATGSSGGTGGLAGRNQGGTLSNNSSDSVVVVQTSGPLGTSISQVGVEVGNNQTNRGYGGNIFNFDPNGTGRIVNNGGDISRVGDPVGSNSGNISNPSPNLGQQPSNAQQAAAAARSQAQALTQQATAQQVAVAQAAAAQAAALQAAAAQAAAFKAASQAGARAANVISTTNAALSAGSPPSGAESAAGTRATNLPASAALEDNFKTIEDDIQSEEQRARRRAAAAAKRQGAARGGNFGATIRSIEINGQRFELQDNAPKGVPGRNP